MTVWYERSGNGGKLALMWDAIASKRQMKAAIATSSLRLALTNLASVTDGLGFFVCPLPDRLRVVAIEAFDKSFWPVLCSADSLG